MTCEPTWTADDLAAIEQAIATGATRVKYADREVSYSSLTDLIRARDLIRRALGCVPADGSRNRRYASFSKGLC